MLVENPQQTTNEAESQSMASSSPEDAFVRALGKEPPKAFTKIGSKLYAASLIGCFCATMDGYNGSLINNLLANKNFLDCYGGSNSGLWSGLVTAMYQIGAVAAFPFVGPAVDTWGRRAGMVIASILTAGTNIQSFMGGSFLLGFGISIAVTAGPTFTGSIIAAGAARGALDIGGNGPWRIIIWLQVLFAGIIVVVALFLPESPRWLYVNGKQTAATEMLIKFHGDGNPDSEWVKLQLNEYEEYLELDGADKRWWDYRALFRNKASIYRLYCNVCISIFAQWMGNAVITYFMSAVLDTAGYKGTVAQHNPILINNCQGFAWSILGASLVDKFGRRPLLLFSNIGCSLAWLLDKLRSGMLFIFNAVYAVGFTPLQALYPVEVLSFEMRAKGMAFSSLATGAAGLLNKFAWPVSIERIAWRTYIIFAVWDAIQAIVIYSTIVETKNRTLEELDEIFKAPNPVMASIKRKKSVAGVFPNSLEALIP
ncbi:conserved hypothetical protein [Coccidioides posadasii str. Silveira]|uniref:Major facilitator superfamily (MFS) profile domain-containing protein n=1 Tax=Coccidioides posadasii (strain RMSCC 757 / Silveira) TaxID=443226 RepID=E9DK57_COCPS|nr:conserved hypothetical protein [Coccidioides posadasii str. Silveira]